MIASRWGEKTYQDYRNDWTRSGHESFLVELAKFGLGVRDLAANLNLFSKVVVDENGNLALDQSSNKAGDYVDLRFEMDTLVVFHTCPHPLYQGQDYPKKPVTYEFHNSEPVAEDDLCKNFCAENQRGFTNTNLYTELHA
jgi:uncharacterized protein YcgI (DUF1989 family)